MNDQHIMSQSYKFILPMLIIGNCGRSYGTESGTRQSKGKETKHPFSCLSRANELTKHQPPESMTY